MSWDRWHHDPREGEHPEPMDLCPHGVDQNEAGCGRCMSEPAPMPTGSLRDVEPWGSRHEMTEAEMTEAFAAFFRDTLDKIDGGKR